MAAQSTTTSSAPSISGLKRRLMQLQEKYASQPQNGELQGADDHLLAVERTPLVADLVNNL